MKTRNLYFATVILVAAGLLLAGCSGGNVQPGGSPTPTPTPQIAVTMSPSAVNVAVGHTQQFLATVTGTTNTQIAFEVNGVQGGNGTVGTISASGLYTAPAKVPAPSAVTVTARSAADTTKTASGNVTVISRPVPTGSWQRTGPDGGTVTVLAEDQSNAGTIWAGTYNFGNGGIWKSTDSGKNWSRMLTNPSTNFDQATSADIFVPKSGLGKTIYLCDRVGFAISTDGGASWKRTFTVPAGGSARGMAVNLSETTIYLSVTDKGVFRSQDGGATWQLLAGSPILPGASLSGTLHNPLTTDLQSPGTVYYGTDHGSFRSTDSGATWSQGTGFAATDVGVKDIAVSPAAPSTIFALVGGVASATASLYKSTDAGATWALVAPTSANLDGERVVPDRLNPAVIYLAGFKTHAVYKSTDSGATFVPADSGLPAGTSAGPSVLAGPTGTMVQLSSGKLLTTITGGGAYASGDGAATWSFSSHGITAWFGSDVAVTVQNPALVYFAATDVGGVFKSTDSGLTWARLLIGNAQTVAIDPFDQSHVLVSMGGLLQSHDGGATWQTVALSTGNALVLGISFDPAVQGRIYLSTTLGGTAVLRSTDGGGSFAAASSGLTTDQALSPVAIEPGNTQLLLVGTNQGIFRSTDGGNTWALAASNLVNFFSFDVLANPVVVYGGGIKSTDLGVTWSSISETRRHIADPSAAGSVFSAVSWSSDAGATFQPLVAGMGNILVDNGLEPGLAITTGASPKMFAISTSDGILSFPVGK